MKIKITEIEATTEDLRVSNSAADGLLSLIRNVFIRVDTVMTKRGKMRARRKVSRND